MIELPEPKIAFSWNDSDHQWSPNFAEWCLLMPEDERVVGYTADQLRTYGDQRAAEAREQMRDECLSLVGICPILRLTQFAWLTQRIKELK